jgi:Ca2+-binding EF-hand superfamily protein
MMHKGNKKGYLDFTDFSKWMGSSIQPSAGFYFRHDSIKNPQYERNLETLLSKNDKNTKVVREKMTENKFLSSFVEKVQFQWKTLKKAFTDLNTAKSGAIMPKELKNYMKHWGYYLTDEQFARLFKKLDFDGDGKISYQDFQNSVGNEISPLATLIFRHDESKIKPEK